MSKSRDAGYGGLESVFLCIVMDGRQPEAAAQCEARAEAVPTAMQRG